ncbi:MAG: hypothetical protein KAZ87_04870 [Spirochaetes bacterium]|nr:hypothetical protein [Spirochaetota bacterium]
MKKTVKLLCFMLILIFSINTISACKKDNSNQKEENNSDRNKDFENNFTVDDLSIIDKTTGKVISIGMSKEKVDDCLGKQNEKNFMNLYNYNGLEVFYRDNKVAGLIIKSENNLTRRFTTIRGIGLGNSKNETIEKYGKVKQYEGNNLVLNYILEKNENRLIVLEGTNQGEFSKPDKTFVITFSFFNGENENLSMVFMGDYTYNFEMR